jgi:hypothetical protein
MSFNLSFLTPENDLGQILLKIMLERSFLLCDEGEYPVLLLILLWIDLMRRSLLLGDEGKLLLGGERENRVLWRDLMRMSLLLGGQGGYNPALLPFQLLTLMTLGKIEDFYGESSQDLLCPYWRDGFQNPNDCWTNNGNGIFLSLPPLPLNGEFLVGSRMISE